jgi:phosphate-selective porin OprO/OprP
MKPPGEREVRRTAARFLAGLVAALLFAPSSVLPAVLVDREPTTFWKRIEEKGVYERIWQALTFYESEENDVVQSVALIGRYHGQYWLVDASQGHSDGWENRRIFIGAEALLFHQVTLHAQIAVSEDLDPFYESLYQAFIEWKPTDHLVLVAGRVDFLFTGMERSTSSNRILTFERGLLVNQVLPGEVVGAGAGWQGETLSWRLGVFSGSIQDEFTDFEGGFGAVAGASIPLPLFFDSGQLHLDYLFNDGDPLNNALQPYDHVVSLWHRGELGTASAGVDVMWAHGLNGLPDVFGVTLLTSCIVATDVLRKGDDFQAVLRYQIAFSDGDNGLRPQRRYEAEALPGAAMGDLYNAFYAGINYRMFGDRLKLMTGIEYAILRDSAADSGAYDGWTCFAGLRTFF